MRITIDLTSPAIREEITARAWGWKEGHEERQGVTAEDYRRWTRTVLDAIITVDADHASRPPVGRPATVGPSSVSDASGVLVAVDGVPYVDRLTVDAGQFDAIDGSDDPSFLSVTCPRCGMTSWNPRDVEEGYCGYCHDWTGQRSVP